MSKQQEKSESPTGTIDQLKVARLERRRDASTRYRELLARNDHPEPGDADMLAGVMRVLGRSPGDLESDIAVVRALAAAEDAQRQADALDKPLQKAKQAFHDTQARVKQERAEFEQRMAAELRGVELPYRKLVAERHTLQTVAAQVPSDQWTALVEGISVEEVIAARRAARRAGAPMPAAVTREDIIDRLRHEMVELNYAPASGTAVDHVNHALRAAGFEPLTEAEINKRGIENWVTPRRGRL